MSLLIPDTDIDPEHWDYLADNEAEVPINAARHSGATGLHRNGRVEPM